MMARLRNQRMLRHAATPEQHSLFFKLPPEMRNKIYFKLLFHGKILLDCKSVHEKTNIPRVCQQIRKEAIRIFYRANEFIIINTL
jgi:hypothetical protein